MNPVGRIALYGVTMLAIFIVLIIQPVSASGIIKSDTPQTPPVYTVNTTSDEIDYLCGIDNCTLRDAIYAAELDGLDSTIELQAGAIYTLNGSHFTAIGRTAFPDITTPLTINGHNAIIERNISLACNLNVTEAMSEFRLFFVSATGNLTISQVTLQNGCSDGDPDLSYNSLMGGAIFNTGILTLNQAKLLNNTAYSSGGAIYNDATATLTITTNTIFSFNSAHQDGGAIFNLGTLTISDSTISHNSTGSPSGGRGGAIYSTGSLILDDCTISQNSAGSGGGIFNFGVASLTACTVANNSVQWLGGGLYNTYSDTITLSKSYVQNNSASSGAGIYNEGIIDLTESTVANNTANNRAGGIYNNHPDASLTILNSNISGNSALTDSGGAIFNSRGYFSIIGTTFSGNSAGGGGGIWAWFTPIASISGSIFTNNSATYDGGGIVNLASTLTVSETSFLNNSANRGGGIDNPNGGSSGDVANLTVTGSTFAGNLTTTGGGAIRNEGIALITNSTLTGNSAAFYGGGLHTEATGITHLNFVTIASNTAGTGTWGDGGGISTFTGGATYLKNSIVGNNIDGNGGAPDCSGATSEGYNLIENISGCTFSALLSDITSRDPRLAVLANNGGSTQTHALLLGSPAIDAADNSGCAAGSVNNLDQRGEARPIDGDNNGSAICDIGAFELEIYRIYLPLVIR